MTNKVKYTLEYANGGWKHFQETFDDRKEYNEFLKTLRTNPRCVGYAAENNRGYKHVWER